jgi:hypothetical protein
VAVVVHAHDERIVFAFTSFGDFVGERREAADVLAEFLAVEINVRLVIRRAKIDKQPVVGADLGTSNLVRYQTEPS